MKPPEIRALVQELMGEALEKVGGEADLEIVRRPGGKWKRPVFAATARSWRADGRILPTVAEALAGGVSGDGFHNATFEFSEGVHSVMGTIRVWHERYRYAVDVWIDKIPAAD